MTKIRTMHCVVSLLTGAVEHNAEADVEGDKVLAKLSERGGELKTTRKEFFKEIGEFQTLFNDFGEPFELMSDTVGICKRMMWNRDWQA